MCVLQRIKSTQVHKLLKEEKDAYIEQVAMLQHQVEVQNNVVRKLEEKERILQGAITNIEKELRYCYLQYLLFLSILNMHASFNIINFYLCQT